LTFFPLFSSSYFSRQQKTKLAETPCAGLVDPVRRRTGMASAAISPGTDAGATRYGNENDRYQGIKPEGKHWLCRGRKGAD
jgi:hypothetical protein